MSPSTNLANSSPASLSASIHGMEGDGDYSRYLFGGMEGDGDYPRYLFGGPVAQFPRLQDGGNGAEDDHLRKILSDMDWLFYSGNWPGTEQPPAGSSQLAGVHHGCDVAPPLEQSPVAAAFGEDAATVHQVMGFDSPAEEPASDVLPPTTTEPHQEELEIAEMVRVSAECGEDDRARTTWSQEEHETLLRYLDLYAEDDDAVTRCFKIAFHLPKKTTYDVALRCRWLQDKRKAAESSAPAKLTKAKAEETKVAKSTKKAYPLSKEALSSKSIKELIRDNDMFLKRIEENLKTGQLANTSDYFYYVKTNMDAILER